MKLNQISGTFWKSVKDLDGFPFDDPYDNIFNLGCKGLHSLEGCPRVVNKTFNCSFNNLTSLKFAPREIGANLIAYHNKITTLEGCSRIINGNFIVSYNKITSLAGIDNFIDEINGIFDFGFNPIVSGGLGILLVKGITSLSFNKSTEPFILIAKYLRKTDQIYECQAELIENGYEEFTQL